MEYHTQIVKMEMDRSRCNGGYFFEGRALINGEVIDFTVRSRSQVYADSTGDVDYACLDDTQGLARAFPIKTETLKLARNVPNNGKGEAILEEFKKQYEKKAEESSIETLVE